MTLLSGTVFGAMSGGIKVAYDDISAALSDDPARDTFAYNDANELTKQIANGTQSAYTYDDWGRTTTKITADTTEEFLYFAGSKLKTYKVGGVAVAHYNYDGFGKRRNKSDGSNVTWWRYDLGWNAIVEYDDADTDWDVETRANSYTYSHGQVGQALGQSADTDPSSGTHTSFMQDRLGSTRGLFDSSKVRVAKLDYSPYGEQTVALGKVPSISFTGKMWDSALGMYYFPNRWYSPDSGRWLTRDPLGMVDGPNMYGYVMGSPVGYVDLLGLTFVPPTPEHQCGTEEHPVPDDIILTGRTISFASCCNHHDNCYGCGGAAAGKSREDCDNAFGDCMLNACSRAIPRLNPEQKKECDLMAASYALTVMAIGGDAFDAARENCDCDPPPPPPPPPGGGGGEPPPCPDGMQCGRS